MTLFFQICSPEPTGQALLTAPTTLMVSVCIKDKMDPRELIPLSALARTLPEKGVGEAKQKSVRGEEMLAWMLLMCHLTFFKAELTCKTERPKALGGLGSHPDEY